MATARNAGTGDVRIGRDALLPTERQLFDRYADAAGAIADPDIRFLLGRILRLRQLFADLVRHAGHPTYDEAGRSVVTVPTETLDIAYAESAGLSGAAQPDAADDSGFDRTGAWLR